MSDVRGFEILRDCLLPRAYPFWYHLRQDAREPKFIRWWVTGLGFLVAAIVTR